ncbi:YqaA family protein [Desulfobulbus sp.]|uniref:YqaA family protein n=1 Tax=Desulfobulbus sp. TaxID=895 RepID=UPI00286EBD57|nr:YqaA family protein [Desulfobulbus sp.]
MLACSALTGLFLASFLAATVLPMQSEAVLVGLLLTGDYSVAALLAVASCGNVLGAVCNWWLGRCIERYRHCSWFPVSEHRLHQARQWYRRYGRWSLLLSWAPIIGDPLTVAAGVMREPLPVFIAIAGGAKVARYLVLTGATLGWLS